MLLLKKESCRDLYLNRNSNNVRIVRIKFGYFEKVIDNKIMIKRCDFFA